MHFQLYSDLHLEFYRGQFPRIPKTAENLILAGDISTSTNMTVLENFFQYCSFNWDRIFYVFGNHEFYGNEAIKILKIRYKKLIEKFDNIILLDNSYVIIDNIAIYGFIGWTIPSTYIIQKGYKELNDYKSIKI